MATDMRSSGLQCESTHLCEDIDAEIEFLDRVTPAKGSRYKCEWALGLFGG